MHLKESVGRMALASLLLTALSTIPAVMAAQEDAPVVVSDTDAPAETPPVAQLFEVRDELESFLLSIDPPDGNPLASGGQDDLDELAGQLEIVRKTVDDGNLSAIESNDLIDLQTEVRSDLRRLSLLAEQLKARATLRDSQLDELHERGAEWQSLSDVARQRNAPASVLAVAARVQTDLETVRADLVADRNALLEGLSTIAELQRLANRFDAELRTRRDALEAVSQKAADAPLWQADAWGASLGLKAAADAWKRYGTVIASHVASNAWGVVGLFALFLGGAYWLLHATGKQVQEGLQNDAASVRGSAVFERPNSAALLAALIGLYWFGPPAPTAFQSLLGAVMPFPAAALAVTVFGKPIRLSIYTLAVVLATMSLRPLLDPLPLLSRFVVIAQAAATLFAVWSDYRRDRFTLALPVVRPSILRWSVLVVCIALVLTIVLEIVGLIGMAETLRMLVLGGLGIAVVIAAIAYVLIALALALVHLRPISALPVVRNQRWTIVQTTRRWIRYAMILLWLFVTLDFSGLLPFVLEQWQNVLAAEVGIGEITLDVSSITAGAGILFVTWLVNSVVRFVLAGKSLSGVHVAADLTFAISKLLRYTIAVVGLMVALAAMGFDLTKVTVLAGALGLGIGFGLQNIVQNFISGLILLFERPIKINDVAKVDDLMGTVRELNIRSTVIETFDGAEVIVPNADLISKTVTNWTKSNRRRRAEIEVGVAYGTDSQLVLDILERVAKAHDEVMTDPEPFAVFVGFGDSSLNFRLYVWLTDLSEVLKTPSRIRQEILEELNAASIGIPFPQRDVRVTVLPDGSPASRAMLGDPVPG